MIALSILLISCKTVPSNTCGILYSYSKEFQAEAAVEANRPEFQRLTHLKQLNDDYYRTRESIRGCKGLKTN